MEDLFSTDREFSLVLQGFDVKVSPSSSGDATVTLFEDNDKVFEIDIPIRQEEEDTVDVIVQSTAQAAIDIFEAQRGTLGQGAGAMKKASYFFDLFPQDREEWYLSLKGTSYETAAGDLLDQYVEADHAWFASQAAMHEAESQLDDVVYQLQKLNVQRLKSVPANTKIIIVKAKQACSAESVQLFLDKFAGDPLEGEVVKLLKQYIELKQQLSVMEESSGQACKTTSELLKSMENMSLEALQSNIVNKIPTEGIEAFPNMAGDIAELMEGVSLDEPLVPMSDVFASRRAQDYSSLINRKDHKPNVIANTIVAFLSPLGEVDILEARATMPRGWDYGFYGIFEIQVGDESVKLVFDFPIAENETGGYVAADDRGTISYNQGRYADVNKALRFMCSDVVDRFKREQERARETNEDQDSASDVFASRRRGQEDESVELENMLSYAKTVISNDIFDMENEESDEAAFDLAKGLKKLQDKFGDSQIWKKLVADYGEPYTYIFQEAFNFPMDVDSDWFKSVLEHLKELPAIEEFESRQQKLPGIGAKRRRSFEEVEPVADRIMEFGEEREHLDPAENELDFEAGDKISLSKAFDFATAGGIPVTLEKGTKGMVKNVYDGAGDQFMVCFPEPQCTVRVPKEYLSKSK